jgi:Methionine synthase I, cobalamin-binding domain
MNHFEKLTAFQIKLNRDIVFHHIDCYPESPVYDEVVSEYEKIESEVIKIIEPKAFFKFNTLTKETAALLGSNEGCQTTIVYALLTIGEEISNLSSHYFEEGDYLLGLLVNAMADTYLFQMDDLLRDFMIESCRSRHFGIEKRLDAPANMPMSVNKVILEEIKKEENLAMEVTEGFMFTPVKTLGYILLLNDDEQSEYSGHNCNTCSQENCKMRKN